jgi:alkyl hydroperoxide reductase subunit F
MGEIMDEKIKRETQKILKKLTKPVKLIYFTQEHACRACGDQQRLLEELARLSEHLRLEVKELLTDDADAKRYKIAEVPATVILSDEGRDYGIRFYGVTGGYEFASFLEALVMVSTGVADLDPEVEAIARKISVPVHLEVMVTLTCPYCPKMVHLAHQLAFINENIRADMVDAAEFPALVQRYQVQGVPRMVINERPAFEGALPAMTAVMEILKEVDPEQYEVLDKAMREARGERLAREAKPEGEYDIIIVGAGPAAMSAAIYAVRKNWRVALLGKKLGGQIVDTATIENWLGVPTAGGGELAEAFQHHLESYPVEIRLHAEVSKVSKRDGVFEVTTLDKQTYRGRTVIYAAGKQYRQLGVPGESRFLGKGVAFCATCDAPLFRDKRVAVIGGGNSAFTAARDLENFAREIHLIYNGSQFRADPILVQQVKKSPNVSFHMSTEIREFIGEEQLTAIRVASVDGKDRYDLPVDGVFLEIGLVPNSGPVKELVELNAAGEIPVRRDQSTPVPGFFAAGDVTDEQEKQIVIAAGDGARAALSADRYLLQLERNQIVAEQSAKISSTVEW